MSSIFNGYKFNISAVSSQNLPTSFSSMFRRDKIVIEIPNFYVFDVDKLLFLTDFKCFNLYHILTHYTKLSYLSIAAIKSVSEKKTSYKVLTRSNRYII